ncbi:glycosyltransferase family 2 protein [Methyloglobulus sp.]|uniref:glycosyltransferase family 2 protein n=1 Tax=Methyloglobulus sp. TaxID=2518622 RepID=UPI001852E76E|nr:glycosyltransferase family 2 protein [Methyloglobulus sp.]
MPYNLCIVIVNYKTPQLLLDCLESLLPELEDNWVIAVVDNASNDNSVTIVENWILKHNQPDNIKLIRSPVNSGFSGGNNIGIKTVQADHYLLLNSDALVRKGAIQTMLNAISREKKVGLIAPRLEWLDGTPQESCFNYHTPISELIGSAKTGLITKIFKKFVVAQPVSEISRPYCWVSFACVMVKAEVFNAIGFLDEGYFMYFEDVEFCRRAKKAGWEIWQEPASHIVHLRGGSSPVKAQAKLRKRLPRYYYESRTRFFFQAYGRVGLLCANLLWELGWSIASFRSLLSPSYMPDTSEKQWRDILINFLNPLKPYIHPDNYGK